MNNPQTNKDLFPVDLSDQLEDNRIEFKSEMAIWLHDLELPKINSMEPYFFMQATYISAMFEQFKIDVSNKLNSL